MYYVETDKDNSCKVKKGRSRSLTQIQISGVWSTCSWRGINVSAVNEHSQLNQSSLFFRMILRSGSCGPGTTARMQTRSCRNTVGKVYLQASTIWSWRPCPLEYILPLPRWRHLWHALQLLSHHSQVITAQGVEGLYWIIIPAKVIV